MMGMLAFVSGHVFVNGKNVFGSGGTSLD